MNFGMLLGWIGLGLAAWMVWMMWRMVRSPLPAEMQQALEKKEEAKLSTFRQEVSQEVSRRMAEELSKMWDQVQGQVRTTEQSVSQKLQQANDTISRLSGEMGRLQEATKRVEEVGRDVTSLQDLLRAPKIRGGLGEFFLADLLAQIMPADYYTLQYEFSDGQRVDAVIHLRDRLVPIDSKFPLDHFRQIGPAADDEERAQHRKLHLKDVKQHIDDIAGKYIRPAEKTFDFALMYIPAENVYYETVVREEGTTDEKGIFQHALARRVIPVSPNSFYAYLQVILLGLRGLMIEQRAQEILTSLMKLHQEFTAVREDFDTAGTQLRNAVKNFEKAERHLGRFEDRLEVIEAPAAGSLPLPAVSSEEVERR